MLVCHLCGRLISQDDADEASEIVGDDEGQRGLETMCQECAKEFPADDEGGA